MPTPMYGLTLHPDKTRFVDFVRGRMCNSKPKVAVFTVERSLHDEVGVRFKFQNRVTLRLKPAQSQSNVTQWRPAMPQSQNKRSPDTRPQTCRGIRCVQLAHSSSSSSIIAALRSGVAKPSVNQP